jgi:hypothetical protein
MMRSAFLATMLLALGLSAGCVTRRFTVTSEPQGAMVYVNGKQIGPSPADAEFVYYGRYRITLVKPGYETFEVLQNIPPPFYEYFGIDLISEVLIPTQIIDHRYFHYKLRSIQSVRPEDVLRRGSDLRSRGRAVATPPAPAPAPPPGSVPLPPPRPVGPPVTP